jgi:acyl-CoA synthetase (AMP-forming)/AMP-acid ligase II
MNIVDPLLFQCRRQPPVAAICVPGPGVGLISYRRLERYIHNITQRLHTLGLPPKSIVAVNIKDVIFHAAVLLALTRLGMVTISLREDQRSLPIKTDALIADPTLPLINMERVALADLSWTEGDGRPLEPHFLPQIHEDDLCRIILTSGTTSTPKGIAISHKMLTGRIARHLTVFGNRFGNCSRIYCDVPISSSLGFQFLIYTLWRGGTVVFPGSGFADTLPALEQYKVQCMVASPGGFENLVRWFDVAAAYQSDIEMLLCMGDVLSRQLSDRLRSRICSHLVAAYGSTEASMSATAHAHEIAEIPRAVGFVAPDVTVEITDGAGATLSPDREGYVRLKSKFAVEHYFDNPEESGKVFRDGWFYPGDIGRLTADGLLVISGREQSMLNLGGDKISPEAIELILSQFNGVIEAAVFATPNEYGNNEIQAAIVVEGAFDEQAFKSYCDARISRQIAPTRIYFVESLPHNDMGKLDRNRLHDWIKRTAQQSS